MWSCHQSLITLALLWEKLSKPQFYKDLTRKTSFLEGLPWFKFDNLGPVLSTNRKNYTSMVKGLKLKVKKFWGLIPTFIENTMRKTDRRGTFCPLSWIELTESNYFSISTVTGKLSSNSSLNWLWTHSSNFTYKPFL